MEGIVLEDNLKKWMTFRKKLKEEWKKLWFEKFNDRVRAEGIAIKDYPLLFIDRGTVIVATRRYKPLSFQEIVKNWAGNFNISNTPYILPPHPSVGGWGKFIRTHLTKSHSTRKASHKEPKPKIKKLQFRKCGRGWLNRF